MFEERLIDARCELSPLRIERIGDMAKANRHVGIGSFTRGELVSLPFDTRFLHRVARKPSSPKSTDGKCPGCRGKKLQRLAQSRKVMREEITQLSEGALYRKESVFNIQSFEQCFAR